MIFSTRYLPKDHQSTFVTVSSDLLETIGPKIGPHAMMVMLYIANQEKKNRKARASTRFLAKATGLNKDTVTKAIKTLKEYDLIDSKNGVCEVKIHSTEEYLKRLVSEDIGQTKCPTRSDSSVRRDRTEVSDRTGQNQEVPPVQKKGEEEGPTHPPYLEEGSENVVPLFVRGFRQEQELELAEAYIKAGETLKSEEALAQQKGNTVMKKSYYQKPLPESFLPKNAPAQQNDVFRKIVLLKATNIIADCVHADGYKDYAATPANSTDLGHLGDVLSSFLVSGDWEYQFKAFFTWVLEHKQRHPYNLLSFFYSDWQESKAARNLG